jgi:hypothetical protein
MVLARGEVPNDAEFLVLRHQNAVPGDRLWLSAPSRLIPRRRWGEVFAVTPATLLAWHSRPAARKWDYYEPAASRTAVHDSRYPQTRDPHGPGQPDVWSPAGARRAHQAWPVPLQN